MNTIIRILTIVALFSVFGCESKRLEKSPEDVPGAQGTLAETKSYSLKVNNEIGKMRYFIRKISALVRTVEIALNPDLATSKRYTLTDTFIDLLDESERGISMMNNRDFSRKSHFEVSAFKDDNPCKKIEMLVEGTKDENNDLGEVSLAVHSCATEGSAFETVATARYNEQKEVVVSLNLRPLQNLFHDGGRSIVEKDLKCDLTSKNKDTLTGLSCQNIKIVLSKDESTEEFEYAILEQLVYSSDSEIAYSAIGSIYELNKKKATFQIRLDKNGRPTSEPSIIRIEPK